MGHSVKNIIMIAFLMVSFNHCNKPIFPITCYDEFYTCASECSEICEKTIQRPGEFGKCFSICNEPCRRDYCKEACMVEMEDTKDLKSFADIKRGGSNPSVSSIL